MTPHEQAQAAVADLVRALPAPAGAPALTVYERLTTSQANVSYPLCLVSIAGLTETRERVGFGLWQWTYPVLVLFALREAPQDPASLAPYAAWRGALETALEEATELPGLPDLFDVACEPAGNVLGSARGRGDPGGGGDTFGPAWLKVAGSLLANVSVLREG